MSAPKAIRYSMNMPKSCRALGINGKQFLLVNSRKSPDSGGDVKTQMGFSHDNEANCL